MAALPAHRTVAPATGAAPDSPAEPEGPQEKHRHAVLQHTGWAAVALAGAWLAGLALQLHQASLLPVGAHAGMVLGAVAVLLMILVLPASCRGPRLPRRWRLGVAWVAVAALAFGSTGWRAQQRLADRLPAALEGQNLRVVGVVSGLPQSGPAGLRFTFEVESATWRGQPVRLPARLALGWYTQYSDETWLEDPRQALRAGQRWHLPLRLKRPQGSLNPDGFDVELKWFEQGIGATGYVRVVRGWHPAERLVDHAGHSVDRLRQQIRDTLLREVADARTAGVLAALVVGDQAAIERDDWDLFRQTGVAHLVSISGLKVL